MTRFLLELGKGWAFAGRQKEIIVSGNMYDDLLFEEYQQMREARKYQMDLERLAGKKTVQKLNLYQYAFKNELFGAGLNAKKAPAQNNGGKNDKK